MAFFRRRERQAAGEGGAGMSATEMLRRAAWLVLLTALAAAVLPWLTPAHGQTGQEGSTPAVDVLIDHNRVTVGDPISLTVTLKYASGITILTKSIDGQLGDLEPLSSEPPELRKSAVAPSCT